MTKHRYNIARGSGGVMGRAESLMRRTVGRIGGGRCAQLPTIPLVTSIALSDNLETGLVDALVTFDQDMDTSQVWSAGLVSSLAWALMTDAELRASGPTSWPSPRVLSIPGFALVGSYAGPSVLQYLPGAANDVSLRSAVGVEVPRGTAWPIV